jgi:hypothetical protein
VGKIEDGFEKSGKSLCHSRRLRHERLSSFISSFFSSLQQGRRKIRLVFPHFLCRNSGPWSVSSSLFLSYISFPPSAYLTNPSESAFRAYLTEQSFRHHLSHLDRFDDDVDEGTSLADVPASSITPNRPSACTFSLENSTLHHFAARASVSLRTPRHAFHSFGIFTVATMLPMAKSGQCEDNHLASTATDSWYIGAFGRWWRGGIIETWYQDVIARSKDEESRCSGILSLSNVDVRHDYAGMLVNFWSVI